MIVRYCDARRPVCIVEKVVERNTVLDEALPLVKPFVADDVPSGRISTLEGLASLFSCNDQLPLQLSAPLDCLQLFRGDVIRIVSEVRIESDWLELEALDTDDI